MSILSYFIKEMNITSILQKLTTTNDGNGYTNSEWVDLVSFKCFKYTKSAATRYFNMQFKEDVSDVLILVPITEINVKDRIVLTDNRGAKSYVIGSIDDVGNQGEVLLVGVSKI